MCIDIDIQHCACPLTPCLYHHDAAMHHEAHWQTFFAKGFQVSLSWRCATNRRCHHSNCTAKQRDSNMSCILWQALLPQMKRRRTQDGTIVSSLCIRYSPGCRHSAADTSKTTPEPQQALCPLQCEQPIQDPLLPASWTSKESGVHVEVGLLHTEPPSLLFAVKCSCLMVPLMSAVFPAAVFTTIIAA